jgi:type III restriction enzyme
LAGQLVQRLGGRRERPLETALLWEPGTLFAQPSVMVSAGLDPQALPAATRETVRYVPGSGQLVALRVLTDTDQAALRDWCPTPADQLSVDRLADRSRGRTVVAGAGVGEPEPFKVPLLGIRVGQQLELFEADHFLAADWNLAQCDASLSEAEFPSQRVAGAAGEIDVSDTGQVEMIRFVAQVQEQLELLLVEPGWTVAALANWLDRQILHRDIPQAYSSLFMHNVVTALLESRGLTVEQLARHKFRLRNAVEAKIAEYRREQHLRGYQRLLEQVDRFEVSAELCLSYAEDRYSPNRYYEPGYRFQKHYFRTIGELQSDGEEYTCAVFIDGLTQVKRWVRNLDRRADSSFWLQTSTDKFYPDFAAELTDGRILVVEYKGEDRWSNKDSEEKRAVGELWADRSAGKCIFVMPKGPDWNRIAQAIQAKA